MSAAAKKLGWESYETDYRKLVARNDIGVAVGEQPQAWRLFVTPRAQVHLAIIGAAMLILSGARTLLVGVPDLLLGRHQVLYGATYTDLHVQLPLLLAVSANSPFLDGEDTGLHSVRSEIFTRVFPRCGIPSAFRSWDEYAGFVATLERLGSIVESTQLWWSVRPHHRFGTVEVRICDAQTRGDESTGLLALIAACAAQTALEYDEHGYDGAGAPLVLVDGIPTTGFSLQYYDGSNPPNQLAAGGGALTQNQLNCVQKVRVTLRAEIATRHMTQPMRSMAESEVAIRNLSLTNF